MWCSVVGGVARLRALSSTAAVTTDARVVTERCFFDRRRGCSSGRRGSRASLQQYRFWMQNKQLLAEAQVVSSSVNAERLWQQHRQYEGRSWCTIPPHDTQCASCEYYLRQATNAKKNAEPLTAQKSCKKSRRATPTHCKATASHFSKKKSDSLSSLGHWPGLRDTLQKSLCSGL